VRKLKLSREFLEARSEQLTEGARLTEKREQGSRARKERGALFAVAEMGRGSAAPYIGMVACL
jgi:hypothetical protein